MIRNGYLKRYLIVFLVAASFAFSQAHARSNMPKQALQRKAVMAPLVMRTDKEWNDFKKQLEKAKEIGVDSVSSDVWWGMVEKTGDQKFDWSYYDKLSNVIIEEKGLKWTPIFSFHQCGGNVGDEECKGQNAIPIPDWLWNKLGGNDPDQLKYKSELGNTSDEVIALWSDDVARKQYVEYIEAFKRHFAHKAEHIAEINISAGPSGEMRYPSYNQHDHLLSPGRGFLQAYSDNAEKDFQDYVRKKYGTLDRVNKAWNAELTAWEQVLPPKDHGGADGFFWRKDYLDTQYGHDFTGWYSKALIEHGHFMLNVAIDALGDSFPGIPLGIKIPGIHWLMSSPDIPRSAEISAGLISTGGGKDYLDSDKTAHGYAPILRMIQAADQKSKKHAIVLHFTCLEMNNNEKSPGYSMASALVFWVGRGAHDHDVAIMGENALSGGVTHANGWDNIENVFQYSYYKGLTVLRVSDLEKNDAYGFQRYRQLIGKYGLISSNN